MTNQEILNKLGEIKKGAYVSLKKKKDLGEGIVKISDIVVRLGVDYANMKINEGRTTPIQPLKWGHWVEGLEGYVIEHTKVDKKTGEESTNYYLRVANSYSNNTKSTYLLNGQEVDKSVVEELVDAKKLESQKADVYNIKFENILALGEQ